MEEKKIRINKYIADAGICSRRDADKLVEQGLVIVNGRLAESGTKVGKYDEVTVRGKKISASEEKIVLAKVPVKKPWEIFEKIPFGGFNECPPANVISAFCKMAHEKFGAVPFAISSDTLEFSLSRRLTKSEALEFAEKLYYFCPNVFEDDETLYEIANGISKSDFCFLWW